MTEIFPEMSLPCSSMAVKFYFQNLKCWFGIWNIGLIPLKRHKIELFSPGRMSEMCPSGVCILYLKWDVSQYGLCSLV